MSRLKKFLNPKLAVKQFVLKVALKRATQVGTALAAGLLLHEKVAPVAEPFVSAINEHLVEGGHQEMSAENMAAVAVTLIVGVALDFVRHRWGASEKETLEERKIN